MDFEIKPFAYDYTYCYGVFDFDFYIEFCGKKSRALKYYLFIRELVFGSCLFSRQELFGN